MANRSKGKAAVVALATVILCCWAVLGASVGARAEVQRGWQFPKVTPDPDPLHILGPAGEYFTFVKTGRSTMGHYSMATALIPSGAGPIPHVHHYTDEWFYFPKGGITIVMGEHPYPTIDFIPGASAPRDRLHFIKTRDGDLFYGPRYIIHGFFNNTTERLSMIFVWTPDDGITDYFREVGQHVGNDPNHLPPIDPRNKVLFATQAPKYGINQSTSYDQYTSGYEWDSVTMGQMDSHRDELVKLLTTNYTTPAKMHDQ